MLPWAGGALLLLAAHDALARVGGGESFSGGGSSSGGGGGGDDGAAELVFYILRFLIWLTIEYPAIGIPVDIIVLILVIRWWLKKNSNTVVTISTSAPVTAPRRLDALRRFDPNFSEITFSDFCYSLYARAHHARGSGDLERYAPYLSEGARNALRGRARAGLREVRGVVIGSFRVVDVRGLDGPQVIVMVAFEANYTEVFAEGEQSWYVRVSSGCSSAAATSSRRRRRRRRPITARAAAPRCRHAPTARANTAACRSATARSTGTCA